MDWYQAIFEVIDMRSFSNLWYWIALAVLWSTTSHWVLGVPYDMITRAQQQGGQAMTDFEDMVRINTNRLLYIAGVSGLWLLGFGCFALTGLAILAFHYDVEFAQAIFLMGFPMSLVGLLSLSSARLIRTENASGAQLVRRMMWHRRWTQVIGMVSIFVTSMYGMFQNMFVGPLGGFGG